MSYNNTNSPQEGGSGGNVWSAGSRGSRGGYSRQENNNDENGFRGRGSYRGSFTNNYPRRGGGSYGFRRSNNNEDDEIEVLKDAIFIQDLPKNITRDDIQDAFSTVGPIKTNERSGGPKIWIYKDRMTGEGNGRATVTYEDEETAQKAISEYHDQHINSLNSVVRVQLAQRRSRNNDRGGFNNNRGYRGGGGRDNNNFRQGYNAEGNFNRGGGGGGGRGFRGRGQGGDRGRGSYRGASSFGANRGGGGGSPTY